MKLLFLLLLLVNLLLFAWHRGALGGAQAGREPERLAQQIEPERIRALTPTQFRELRDKAREAGASSGASSGAAGGAGNGGAAAPGAAALQPVVLSAADLAGGLACVELGEFSEAQAARVRARLQPLNLGERLSELSAEVPGWFMVYVPPFKTRAEVDRAAAQLRELGVRDLLVIADNSPMRFGIALGSFRDQELARNHLAGLERRGVKGARVADKPSTLPALRLRLRAVDAGLGQQLAELQKEFPQARATPCAP